MGSEDNSRTEEIKRFISQSGWNGASIAPLVGDASTRSYQRLNHPKLGKALLMSAPPAAETASCPPEATPQERTALGYNACARLAGPNLHAFIEVAKSLSSAGLSAPEILVADPTLGLALIEDLGDDLFARIADKVPEETLYRNAIDVLISLRNANIRPARSDRYQMLDYDETAMRVEVDLLTEWYWPLQTSAAIEPGLRDEYLSLWNDILSGLSHPHMIVLRDFHAENLLWLPDRSDEKRTGLIDFQDALFGHAAYDLVSLLEDARRDVSPKLADQMTAEYCAQATHIDGFDKDQFHTDYAILAAQRNAKILGIFARLAKRDNKPQYLDLLPRVERLFARDLQRPALADLREFFARHLPKVI